MKLYLFGKIRMET